MRNILGLILVTGIAVTIALWAAEIPGHISGTVAGITIETSPAIALAALSVVVLIAYGAFRVVAFVLSLPRRLGARRQRGRRSAGDEAVTRTLLALASGDPAAARHQSARARQLLGDTPQTLLHAAESARLAGKPDEATVIYSIMAERKDAGFLGLRGLFRQAVAREDWERASKLAGEAEALNPGGLWLRTERTQLAVRTGNWAQALALAAPDGPKSVYAVAAARAEKDSDRAMSLARRAWKHSPAFVPAILTYAALLRAAGKEPKALAVLRDSWKLTPHPDLAALALEKLSDPTARATAAASLVHLNPEHNESHMLLARLNLETGDLPEARRHAEAARKAGLNERRLWLLLADLEKREHGDTAAGRDALMHAANADSDPGWRCEACGTGHVAWLPVCQTCHTPGRVGWGVAAASSVPWARMLAPDAAGDVVI